jgi:hypothetical protein
MTWATGTSALESGGGNFNSCEMIEAQVQCFRQSPCNVFASPYHAHVLARSGRVARQRCRPDVTASEFEPGGLAAFLIDERSLGDGPRAPPRGGVPAGGGVRPDAAQGRDCGVTAEPSRVAFDGAQPLALRPRLPTGVTQYEILKHLRAGRDALQAGPDGLN